MALFNTAKYGRDINSYDILKFIAILLMVVDHIGYFFFPEQPYWRVVGRICAPMWFFMVGYSKARWQDKKVIGAMLLLIAVDAYIYSPIFSLNILATITLVRLVHALFLNRYIEMMDNQKLVSLLIVILILYPLAFILWEYGTLALLFSTCGVLVRQGRQDRLAKWWFAASVAIFCGIEGWLFKFSLLQNAVMTVGIAVVALYLFGFSMKSYKAECLRAAKPAFLFIARNSLYIYVVHWIIFLSMNCQIHPENYMKFQWFKQAPLVRVQKQH